MKMVRVVILLIMMPLTIVSGLAQIDTTRREFFPLHIGDLWQYRNETNRLVVEQVVGDTIIEGIQFFRRINSLRASGGIVRVDSLMRVEIFGGAPNWCVGESVLAIYRLAEPESSVWRACSYFYGLPTPTPLVRFDGIRIRSIFGKMRETMDFSFGGVIETGDTLLSYGATLVGGIGIYYEGYYDSPFFQLYGAIINGVQYGTIVGVEEIPATIPASFVLHQNYPNPFNSSTMIQYDLPQRAYVRLTVHDVLGREAANLVQEVQNAGRYQIHFNAGNLSSGVYMYIMHTGNSPISRRMIILK